MRILFCRIDNVDIIMKHANWVLSKSEHEGVTIFTDRPRVDTVHEKLKIPAVLEVLEPFEEATMLYLEYLINVRGSEVSHTHECAMNVPNKEIPLMW